MTRLLALTALASTVAALAATAAPAATVGPLTIETRLTPRYVFFGDTITARLDVLFDPRVVDASSVEASPSFGLWQEIGAPQETSSASATLVRETWQFEISCLTYGCVPKQPSVQTFKLPRFTVTARSRTGATTTADVTWPSAQVSARYYPPEVGNVRPALRPETQIPAATYSIAPGLLAWLLDAAGGVLIAGAVAAAALLGYRRWASGRAAAAERSAVEHALLLVRQAQAREPDDRRRAVDLLARTLGSQPSPHVRTAAEVAWSKPEPSPERLERLADSVGAELEGEAR